MAPGLVHDLGLKLMEGRGDTRTLRTCQGTTQYSTNVGGRAQSCARRVVMSDLPALGARTGRRGYATVLRHASSAWLYTAAAVSSRSMAARYAAAASPRSA